jgi:hypothetical protein
MIRTGASFLSWAVAVIAAIITVPTLWVATHVANEDGVPAVTRPVVVATLGTVARRTSEEPGFAEAWEESQRRTHRLTFGPDANTDRLTADIGPIAAFVGQQATKNLPVRVTFPETLKVPIYDAPDREVLDQVEKTPNRSRIGLLVVGLASVLCVVFARRRINAVVALSAGAVLTGGLLLAVTGLALPEVLGRTPARTPFARQMRDLLVDRASQSLDQWLLGIVVIGGVALVIAGLGRALPRR